MSTTDVKEQRVASTNGSEPVKPATGGPRPRTEVARPEPLSQDPKVLVADIERTRADLAETFDAIADKVSPQRVADRTRQQATEMAEVLRQRLTEQSAVAKRALLEAKEKALAQVGAAKERVTPSPGTSAAAAQPGVFARPTPAQGPAPLPPVHGVPVDGLDLTKQLGNERSTGSVRPPASSGGPTLPEGVKPEHVAGGALGLLVLLLLRRRRRRRKAAAARVVVKKARKKARNRR